MTGTATLTSTIVPVDFLDNGSFQCVWTGTPVGSFFVDVTNYDINNPNITIVWSQITLSSVPAASGSAGDGTINLNQLPFRWIRLRYVNSSGTGTLNVVANVKEL